MEKIFLGPGNIPGGPNCERRIEGRPPKFRREAGDVADELEEIVAEVEAARL
jgi:hypothetical protein